MINQGGSLVTSILVLANAGRDFLAEPGGVALIASPVQRGLMMCFQPPSIVQWHRPAILVRSAERAARAHGLLIARAEVDPDSLTRLHPRPSVS